MHWPGGSFPPTIDSDSLITIDGSSPGAVCAWSNERDLDMLFVASSKAEKPSYMPMSITTTDLEGDEQLKYLGMPFKSGKSPEAKARLEKYRQQYRETIAVEGYTPADSFVVDNVLYEKDKGLNWMLADFPTTCSISPIYPANGWGFDIPDDSKEFVMISFYGKVIRNALILKNAEGKYDRVAIYKDKNTSKPIAILENDVFTTDIYDEIPTPNGMEKVYHNMRMLKIAEDGTYVRIWRSRGMSCEDDSVWFPKSLFKEVTDKFGPPQPTSQMTGNDADLILKCNNEQWIKAAEWQSKLCTT